MKRLTLIALLAAPFLAAAQGTSKKPLAEFTYITPQMTRPQIDSIKTLLRRHDLTLNIDTLVYDNHEKIKEISGSLDTRDAYYPLSSTDFRGMTIISRGDSIAVIMGILPRKK